MRFSEAEAARALDIFDAALTGTTPAHSDGPTQGRITEALRGVAEAIARLADAVEGAPE